MKQCRLCKIWKPLNQFYPKKEAADKHEYRCKKCQLKRRKEYGLRPEVKERRRKYYKNRYRNTPYGHLSIRKCWLRKEYGITLEQYNQMLKKQKGVCAICGKYEAKKNKFTPSYLSVDHNHKTGKVRGLLCNKCNNGLGCMNDDIIILKNAIKYLRKNNV